MTDDIRNDIRPGMVVKVHQKLRDEKGKERFQIFEGIVLAVKHGKDVNATFTVRKETKGYGVEKIFPIHSPNVAKVEFVRQMRVRQSRPYYIRTYNKKLREVKGAAVEKAKE